MINRLRMQGFKSWQDSGDIRMGKITGFFGANSSGKTALLQCLLMLKQTAESTDRSRVLHTGDERTYVDLGTIFDVIYGHDLPGRLRLELDWTRAKPLRVADPEQQPSRELFSAERLAFDATILCDPDQIAVKEFAYSFAHDGKPYRFGMALTENSRAARESTYDLISEGYEFRRERGRAWPLPAPIKSYGFPPQAIGYFQNAGFLSEFALAFEELFGQVYYLGPLREYPHRTYTWAGDRPQDVGRRGELAVHALLAARRQGQMIGRGKGRRKQTLEERVAQWLQDLDMIDGFDLRQIAENRQEYEVRVRRAPKAAEVAITDVGFGVSQVLPVLVLCYYAPEHSTIILEQPEIHLHPSVQAGLADVFVDAAKHRKVQIILESHSEYLLRRLQRRIAEGELEARDATLYFAEMSDGASRAQRLELDLFGSITNWPADFFGDAMGDLVAQAEAEIRRRGNEQAAAS